MAKFSLNIVTDAAAVAEDGREHEIARILRTVPQRVEDGETSGILRDVNGVNVGSWDVDLPVIVDDDTEDGDDEDEDEG